MEIDEGAGPLPPDQWPPDSPKCQFLGRVLQAHDPDEVWNALRSGKLRAAAYWVDAFDFGPRLISPFEFLRTTQGSLFRTYQLELVDRDTRRPVAKRRRVPVDHWVYCTFESVAALTTAATPGNTKRGAATEKLARERLAQIMTTELHFDEAYEKCGCGLGPRVFRERVWNATPHGPLTDPSRKPHRGLTQS